MNAAKPAKQRFHFIDQFRGLVGILMILGHSSYYFNGIWRHLDPDDPLFASWGQFFIRYIGYLCAPGFLMMNGAMVWYSYVRRRANGESEWHAKKHLLIRGLLLVLVQVTWVNSSWGGFAEFKPDHLGIIATIGLSMCFLTFLVDTKWWVRLMIALAVWIAHPFLLQIPYDREHLGLRGILLQTFIDAGEFNKYPVLPWFGFAAMGSVMAHWWVEVWKTTRQRVSWSLAVSTTAALLAVLVRLGRGYGNIFPFSDPGSFSFFLDQKYPPSLYHNLWFFGAVVTGVAVFQFVGHFAPKVVAPFGVVGRVPLFNYCVHIAILGIFSKRADLFYRLGDVSSALLGWMVMVAIMLPLAWWFGGVKRRSDNFLIQLI